MKYITLDSLILGLDDLLTKRLTALQSFDAGKTSAKFLIPRRDKIKALPPELLGRPLADELAAADVRHDGFGGVLWFSMEAILRHPDCTPEMASAATKIRATLIPSLDALQARYDVEAITAKKNEANVEALKAELMMFPSPVGGGTLYDVATGFIAEGKKLGALLSDRADAKDRKAASVLRGEVLAKLNRLRDDLLEEVEEDANLPADLEAQVFAYFDELEEKDALAAVEEKKAEVVKKALAAKKKAEAEAKKAGGAVTTPTGPTGPTPPKDPSAPAGP